MDYKKIIKSRAVRGKILQLLSFIPDKTMLKIQYRIKLDRKLNLSNPQRFTEKMQWYKLYYRDPEMVRCVDKYDVRSYVEELGLGHILNECYGVYDSPEEIDFNALPDRFVLKDTLGGGGNSVIIVKDKSTADWNAIKAQLTQWVNKPHRIKSGGREWPYYNGKKHRIIAEHYIDCGDNPCGLIDYKFFCFDGICKVIYILGNRIFGESVQTRIFDENFHPLSVKGANKTIFSDAEVPENADELRAVAEKLGARFPQVRVDLYNVNGKIIFGELTFYNASGYTQFDPDEFDFEMGKHFRLYKFGEDK